MKHLKLILSLSTFLWAGYAMSIDKKYDLSELKKKLTPEQYGVMCNEDTEPPFQNAYWNNKKAGLYVDRISNKALFSSLDKYDSGTGWPSFTKPIDEKALTTKSDNKLGMSRVEVRSASSDAHLGHVFDDGPGPGGKRFCMNSASLRFIPVEDLDKEGFGEYKKLFEQKFSPVIEEALFGGGCFWGVEDIVRKIPGVIETEVGYAGGELKDPHYGDVKKGHSGHAEVVFVRFDSSKVSYEKILETFFRLHDPTTKNRQGNDVGTQYRSVIFAKDDYQKEQALKAKEAASKSGRWKDPVVTEIVPWTKFWKAEDYHQDYLKKNPGGYTCHWLRD